MTVDKYFEKIVKRQREIEYSFPKSLNAPADLKQIEKIENRLGFQFTETLKELYLFANGSSVETSKEADNCLMPLHRFLNLSESLRYYNENIRNEVVFDELFTNWDTNERPGKKLFPFLADDSHCFWVDLNDSTKNFGRIYSAFYAGESPEYQFNSLTILFQVILESYERNIFFLDEYKELSCDYISYGELCQRLNPDIKYWEIATENWRQYLSNT
jgi:cell wall assembly regulator SMI1